MVVVLVVVLAVVLSVVLAGGDANGRSSCSNTINYESSGELGRRP